jgi:hypothetical protein
MPLVEGTDKRAPKELELNEVKREGARQRILTFRQNEDDLDELYD